MIEQTVSSIVLIVVRVRLKVLLLWLLRKSSMISGKIVRCSRARSMNSYDSGRRCCLFVLVRMDVADLGVVGGAVLMLGMFLLVVVVGGVDVVLLLGWRGLDGATVMAE